MAQIDTKLAKKIAKKLEAEIDKTASAHDMACVFHDGLLIASFGIRRGSKKDTGHNHIPKDLNVNLRFAQELGRCTKSRDEFLVEAGHVPV